MRFLWKLGAAANSQRLKGKTPLTPEPGPAWLNTGQQTEAHGLTLAPQSFITFLFFSLKALKMPFVRALEVMRTAQTCSTLRVTLSHHPTAAAGEASTGLRHRTRSLEWPQMLPAQNKLIITPAPTAMHINQSRYSPQSAPITPDTASLFLFGFFFLS